MGKVRKIGERERIEDFLYLETTGAKVSMVALFFYAR